MRSTTLWRIDVVLLVLHAVGATAAWVAMPPRMPTHFTAAGTPNAWSGTTIASWFVSVVMYGALVALLIGTILWSRLLRRTLHRVTGALY